MFKAKKIFYLLKLLILIASFGFIYFKIINQEQIEQLLSIIQGFSIKKYSLLGFVIFLMLVNWTIESYKWKVVIAQTQSIDIFTAIKSIFAGITISIFTPNRTGEFAGRILALKSENRIKAIFSTFVGNLSQLVITLCLGIFAYLLISLKYKGVFLDSYFTPLWANYVAIIALMLILLAYCNIEKSEYILSRFKLISRFRNYYESFYSFNKKQLSHFLILSLLRYSVFIFQFVIVLIIFEIHLNIFFIILSVCLIYLILTVIPTIALSELGVRGTVAIFVLGSLTDNLSGIFFASTTIWLINLVLPALIGSFIIYRSKI